MSDLGEEKQSSEWPLALGTCDGELQTEEVLSALKAEDATARVGGEVLAKGTPETIAAEGSLAVAKPSAARKSDDVMDSYKLKEDATARVGDEVLDKANEVEIGDSEMTDTLLMERFATLRSSKRTTEFGWDVAVARKSQNVYMRSDTTTPVVALPKSDSFSIKESVAKTYVSSDDSNSSDDLKATEESCCDSTKKLTGAAMVLDKYKEAKEFYEENDIPMKGLKDLMRQNGVDECDISEFFGEALPFAFDAPNTVALYGGAPAVCEG